METRMETRYPLTADTLDHLCREGPAPGRTVYILEGLRGSEYGPAAVRVARQPLHEELAACDRRAYPTFRYREYASAPAAYEAACHAYHTMGGEAGYLEDPAHPASPNGAEQPCPVAGCAAPRDR